MRLNWPPPWDLVASVLISVLTLIIIFLSPEPVLTFSAPLGLLLVILLPGHLLAFCLFPAKDDLDLRSRALLGLGLSAAVAALVGLGLSLTPRGLQLASLATMLSLLALFLAAVSYLRWSSLPRRKRSAARSRRSLRNTAPMPIPAKNHLLVLMLILAAILALAAFAFDANRFPSPSGEKDSTEFNVSWPDGAANTHAYLLTAGATGSAVASIINHEHALVNYTLRLVHNNTTLFRKDVSLSDNQSWQEPSRFQLGDPAGPKRLDFLLFKDGDSVTPYREKHLLVSVIEDESRESNNSSQIKTPEKALLTQGSPERMKMAPTEEPFSYQINASATEPPITMEQKGKFAVLGTGENNSDGDSHVPRWKPSDRTDQESKADLDHQAADKEPAQIATEDQQAENLPATSNGTDTPGDQQSNASHEPDINSLELEGDGSQTDSAKKPSLQQEQLSAATMPKASSEDGSSRVEPSGASGSSNTAQDSGIKASTPKTEAQGSPTATVQKPTSTSGSTVSSGNAPKTSVSQKTLMTQGSPERMKMAPTEEPSSYQDRAAPAAINKEINSWVGTRGITSSDRSPKTYQSQNIKYVRDDKGERAVLGRSGMNVGEQARARSKEPRRLG